MHARVAKVQFQMGKSEAGIRVFQDEVLAYASQQPGFVDAFLLLDRDSGVAISISLWETEEAMTTGEVSPYYQEQVMKLLPFLASVPEREAYTVEARARS